MAAPAAPAVRVRHPGGPLAVPAQRRGVGSAGRGAGHPREGRGGGAFRLRRRALASGFGAG
eukprot:344536-Lingulodinium_polyedra.AAC.1